MHIWPKEVWLSSVLGLNCPQLLWCSCSTLLKVQRSTLGITKIIILSLGQKRKGELRFYFALRANFPLGEQHHSSELPLNRSFQHLQFGAASLTAWIPSTLVTLPALFLASCPQTLLASPGALGGDAFSVATGVAEVGEKPCWRCWDLGGTGRTEMGSKDLVPWGILHQSETLGSLHSAEMKKSQCPVIPREIVKRIVLILLVWCSLELMDFLHLWMFHQTVCYPKYDA